MWHEVAGRIVAQALCHVRVGGEGDGEVGGEMIQWTAKGLEGDPETRAVGKETQKPKQLGRRPRNQGRWEGDQEPRAGWKETQKPAEPPEDKSNLAGQQLP